MTSLVTVVIFSNIEKISVVAFVILKDLKYIRLTDFVSRRRVVTKLAF